MNITKYTGYFHDGYVTGLFHKDNNISFSLESSIIEDVNQIPDKECLSSSNTFKGRLNIYGIIKFKLGNETYNSIFVMEYDNGEILDLEICGNSVFLLIEWENFPPKMRETALSKIEIEAERIEWISDQCDGPLS